MPQSLSKVIVHIIFSTKDRDMLILLPSAVISVPKWCVLAASLIMFTVITTLPRTVSQADLVERIKKTFSSHCRALLRLAPLVGRGLR